MDKLSKRDVLAPATSSGDASGRDLSGVNLRGTDLTRAKLDGVKHDEDLRELLSRYSRKQ